MIKIAQILVVSLPRDPARRAHIEDHLPRLDIAPYKFIDAIDADDPQVRNMYAAGLVTRYPPCFRCHEMDCGCENNILVPQQVANWLSFKKVWEICSRWPDSFFLICEDDVAFHSNAERILSAFCREFSPSKSKVLVRMSRSGLEPFRELDPANYSVSSRVAMSNAAFALNGHMARFLLENFSSIATTSDIWIHKTMATHQEVEAVTIEPLLATDLSFNKSYARFLSRIHPKGIDASDEQRANQHTKRASSIQEYNKLWNKWTLTR